MLAEVPVRCEEGSLFYAKGAKLKLGGFSVIAVLNLIGYISDVCVYLMFVRR